VESTSIASRPNKVATVAEPKSLPAEHPGRNGRVRRK
jgi:hypothetical protein